MREVKKRNERGGSEGFDFLFFHFCSRECRERIFEKKEREVSFFVKPGESTERVRVVSRGFTLEEKGWGAVGLRGPFFSLYMYLYLLI